MLEKQTDKGLFRINVTGYQEILDRIRHPLYIVRDDIQRKNISPSTHMHIEKNI